MGWPAIRYIAIEYQNHHFIDLVKVKDLSYDLKKTTRTLINLTQSVPTELRCLFRSELRSREAERGEYKLSGCSWLYLGEAAAKVGLSRVNLLFKIFYLFFINLYLFKNG